MSKKTGPPTNYAIGRERGIVTRKRRSAQRDKEVWDAIVIAAYYFSPRTLSAYADEINDLGLRSPNGAKWTAQKLSHVFKRHGTTAKKLTLAAHAPSPYKAPQPAPEANLREYRRAIERYESLTPPNGVWTPATEATPAKADIVRHPEFGEGQFVAEESLGRLRCSFMNWEEGPYEVVVPAQQTEVFCHKRTREERQLLEERLAEKWLRPPFE